MLSSETSFLVCEHQFNTKFEVTVEPTTETPNNLSVTRHLTTLSIHTYSMCSTRMCVYLVHALPAMHALAREQLRSRSADGQLSGTRDRCTCRSISIRDHSEEFHTCSGT
jgi:hypothetical protein